MKICLIVVPKAGHIREVEQLVTEFGGIVPLVVRTYSLIHWEPFLCVAGIRATEYSRIPVARHARAHDGWRRRSLQARSIVRHMVVVPGWVI